MKMKIACLFYKNLLKSTVVDRYTGNAKSIEYNWTVALHLIGFLTSRSIRQITHFRS